MAKSKISDFNVYAARLHNKVYVLKIHTSVDCERARKDELACTLFNESRKEGSQCEYTAEQSLELAGDAKFKLLFRWDDFGCVFVP